MEITDTGKELLLAKTDIIKSSQATGDNSEAKNYTFYSICLCAAFFGLGLCMALPGPTLGYLQETANTTESRVTLIFTGRGTGYLAGSLMSGSLLDRVKETPVMALCLMLMAAVTIAIPWGKSLQLLVFLFVLQGISIGCLTTGGNHLSVNIWGQRAAPYMQAMHLAMGIGSFAAPLLVELFLHHLSGHSLQKEEDVMSNHTNDIKQMISSYTTVLPTQTISNHVNFSYLIVGLLLVKISLMFCCLESNEEKKERGQKVISNSPENFRTKVLVSLFFFYFAAAGIQNTYGALSTRFSIEYFNFQTDRATFVAALFWGSFAMFQFATIILSRYGLTPTATLVISLSLSVFSLMMLATLGKAKHQAILWICTASLGMGLATIFPTGIVWTERYMKITAKATSVLVVGAAIGETTMPLLVGSAMHTSTMWLMYILLIVVLLKTLVFCYLFFLTKRTGERYYNPLVTSEDMDDVEDEIYDKSWLSSRKGNKLKPTFITEQVMVMKDDMKHD